MTDADGFSVELNSDRGDKNDGRYLTLVLPASRGNTSPYTVTHELLIVNLDEAVQRRLYEVLHARFK